MNWNDLERYHLQVNSSVIKRNKDVQVRYELKSTLLKNILLNNIRSQEKEEGRWVYKQNDFPYDISKNIRHLVVWVFQKREDEEATMMDIKQDLEEKKIKRFVLFENTPEIKSIPEIRHFHLFVDSSDVVKL